MAAREERDAFLFTLARPPLGNASLPRQDSVGHV
jgi:hypothetical protein